MNALKGLVSLLGRVLLGAIFLMSAPHHIQTFNEGAGMLGGKLQGVIKDAPPVLAQVGMAGAIAFMILGGVSLVVGYKTRIGALLLFLFVVPAAVLFHDFWAASGDAAQNQMIHFMKNLSIAGGLLFVVANGGGAWSLDGCFKGAPSGGAA
jgi:putative oxidoreductase